MCFPIIYIQKISVFYVINIESYLFDIKIHLVHYFLTAMSFKVVTLSQITILSTILFQVYKFCLIFLFYRAFHNLQLFFFPSTTYQPFTTRSEILFINFIFLYKIAVLIRSLVIMIRKSS